MPSEDVYRSLLLGQETDLVLSVERVDMEPEMLVRYRPLFWYGMVNGKRVSGTFEALPDDPADAGQSAETQGDSNGSQRQPEPQPVP